MTDQHPSLPARVRQAAGSKWKEERHVRSLQLAALLTPQWTPGPPAGGPPPRAASIPFRTAYCEAPYPGTTSYGQLETPPDELRETMARAAANGLQLAVHAIGDLAAGLALDAFESVGCPGRIEHAQLLRPDDFALGTLIAGRWTHRRSI